MGKKTAKPRTGRPPKSPNDRKDSVLRIRLTDSERDVLDEVAGVGKLSSWARRTLLEAAERESGGTRSAGSDTGAMRTGRN